MLVSPAAGGEGDALDGDVVDLAAKDLGEGDDVDKERIVLMTKPSASRQSRQETPASMSPLAGQHILV